MEKMKYQINFKPTKNHLEQIEKWLITEMEIDGEGFYNNWELIRSAYEKKNLITFTENDFAIGFLVYDINELIIEIKIANIKQNYRKKGFGRKLVEDTLDEFQKQGIMVCELFCSPGNSEPIWKSLGFRNFPYFPYHNEIRMFKELVSTNEAFETKKESEQILLWNSEPHIANNKNPEWTWNLIYKENTNELLKPIIYPAHSNWQICWQKENEIRYKGQVKKFENERIQYGDFIIITSLM